VVLTDMEASSYSKPQSGWNECTDNGSGILWRGGRCFHGGNVPSAGDWLPQWRPIADVVPGESPQVLPQSHRDTEMIL
jgi:hypothetical protein